MTVYLPWLAAMLAGALELEGAHRLRRALFGVHPIPAGARWLLLCVLGMGGAAGLSYTLIYFARALHVPARGYWLPWIVYFGYMVVVAERERRAQRNSYFTTTEED
jgi:hypothetical protein